MAVASQLDDLSNLGFERTYERRVECAGRQLVALLRAACDDRVQTAVFCPGQSIGPGGEQPTLVRDGGQTRNDSVMRATGRDHADRARQPGAKTSSPGTARDALRAALPGFGDIELPVLAKSEAPRVVEPAGHRGHGRFRCSPRGGRREADHCAKYTGKCDPNMSRAAPSTHHLALPEWDCPWHTVDERSFDPASLRSPRARRRPPPLSVRDAHIPRETRNRRQAPRVTSTRTPFSG